jgi:hypothetical protein
MSANGFSSQGIMKLRPLIAKRGRAGIGNVAFVGAVVGILIVVSISVILLTSAGNGTTSAGTVTSTTSSYSLQSKTSSSSSYSSSYTTTSLLSTTTRVTHSSTSPLSSTISSTTSSSTTQVQGGPLRITVSKTISDSPEASAGETAYIYDVTVTNIGSGSYDVNPFYFSMITTSNYIYDTTALLAMRQYLSAVTLNQGQSTSGQVAFQFPNTQTPSGLEFNNQFEGVDELVAGLPQPTVWVSEPMVNLFGGSITLTGVDSLQLLATYSFNNNTFYYYTGDIITLKVALNDLNSSGSVTLNALTLASSDSGFTLSSISPSLPVTVTAGGGVVDVYVYIVAPASSFTGAISLNGTTN